MPTTGPLAAQVAAQGLQNFAGLTDAAGFYTLTVAVDTYTVTASAFGYTPASVSGLQVLTDTMTVQDFALAPTASTSVEGFITDVNTGWGCMPYRHHGCAGGLLERSADGLLFDHPAGRREL
jgi:hypothetical protein